MAEEQQQAKVAREIIEECQVEDGVWYSLNGVPMDKIRCSASELIPTMQYGNVLVGPCSVERFVPNDGNLRGHIRQLQTDVEASVAEERETVQALMRSRIPTA